MLELKEYKEYFKGLPKEEFSELERALDAGLSVTKQYIEGAGYSLLEKKTTKKFVQKLPIIYSKFESLGHAEKLVEKKEKLLEKAKEKQTRRFSNYVTLNPKIVIPCKTADTGLLLYGSILCLIEMEKTIKGSPAHLAWTACGAAAYGIALFSAISIFGYLAERRRHEDQARKIVGATVLGAAGLAYLVDKKSDARERIAGTKMGLAKRKQRKAEERLRKNIKEVFHQSLPYSRKWLREQKQELLGMLGGCDKGFIRNYLELESKLAAFDRLELVKSIEYELGKNLMSLDKKELWQISEFYNKILLAKKAKICTQDLEERLGRFVKSAVGCEKGEIKRHEDRVKELKNISKRMQG